MFWPVFFIANKSYRFLLSQQLHCFSSLEGEEVESSDSGSVPSMLRRKGSDSSGSAGSLGTKGKLRSFRSQFSLNTAGTLRKSLPENLPDLSQMSSVK